MRSDLDGRRTTTAREVLTKSKPSWPTTRDFLDISRADRDALEAEFFGSVMLPNGTFKTTSAGRLSDLDAFVAPFLGMIPNRPVQILDVGVSSGISTAEWAESLSKCGVLFQMTAMDKLINAQLISVFRGFEVLASKEGDVLHLDLAGRGLSPARELRRRAHLLPLKVALKLAFRLFNSPELPRVPIRLLSQRIDQRVAFVEDDLLNPTTGYEKQFDVIRAANILNLVYFSRPVLMRMVRTLKERLKDGGLLIVCRTREIGNEATVFALKEGRIEIRGRLRQGSEIEDIVLNS